jgi:CheY-like chemotaxis protein
MNDKKRTLPEGATDDEINILVVDDAPVCRRMAGSIIEKNSSWRATYAEDGAVALATIARETPSLILTDLQMPNMNGLELVGAVRQQYPLIPVVVINAYGNEEIAARALREGAASYVPKKYLRMDLFDTVHRILAATVDDRSCLRLMDRVVETTFLLENDLGLISELVAHLRQDIQQRGICDENDALRFATAIDEALLNAYYHGNLEVDSALKQENDEQFHALAKTRLKALPYAERRIAVTARYSPVDATFVIRDEGSGFNPDDLADPTDPEYLERPYGRGLLLMRFALDEVTFNDVGNEVTLVKRKRPESEIPNKNQV